MSLVEEKLIIPEPDFISGLNSEQKKAVEEKFKVKVLKVAITNRKGKAKQMTVKSGGRTIRTNGYTKLKKRAIVTLMEGYNIDLFSV